MLLEFTRSWLSLKQYCFRCDLNYLSLNHIVLSSSIHHLIIFLCPPADLNTICFCFEGPLHCPPSGQLSKDDWEELMSLLFRVLQIRSMLFLFDNLYCSEIKSHISKIIFVHSNCWNEIREMSVLESQAFWSKAQHTPFKIYSPLIILYFKNRNWLVVRLKWLFHGFLCQFLIFDLGYIIWWSVMRWPSMNFKENKSQKSELEGFIKNVCFLLSTYFISMHNNQ